MSNSAINRTARALTDAELAAQGRGLRREIPAAQSLLSAIKRELLRRKRRGTSYPRGRQA